jgi:hypothetical protein
MTTRAADAVSRVPDHPWTVTESPPWLSLDLADAPAPAQGWKLHVSAHAGSYLDVLEAVLPVLAAHRVNAKTVIGSDELVLLNDGTFGLTQVGKVVTVYPHDDGQALALAAALDAVTSELTGPAVPFDRRLRPDSLVHYRYGGFTTNAVRDGFGAASFVVTDDAGALVPDDRTRAVPEWIVDPFVGAGIATAAPRRPALLAGRYVSLRTIRRAARGDVSAAMDLESMRPVVLKRAAAWATLDDHGRDARDRLRNEASLLERLKDAGLRVPEVLDLVEDGDDLVLVLEQGPATTLAGAVGAELTRAPAPPMTWVLQTGEALAGTVEAAHGAGVLLVDLSPTNVLLDESGDPWLVDLEVAWDTTAGDLPWLRTTTGYGAPATITAGGAPTAADDVFALGALLWLMMTGRPTPVEPGLASLTPQRLRVARPDAPDELIDLVTGCLARDRATRPPRASAVASALRAISARPRPSEARAHRPPSSPADIEHAARAAAATLAADIEVVCGAPDPERSMAGGLAGMVHAAATVARCLDDVTLLAVARDALPRLRPDAAPDPAPGLFTGAAGIAVTLAHPALATDADRAAATQLALDAVSREAPSFDLVNGWAGVLRGLLLVASVLAPGADQDLLLARACEVGARLESHIEATAPRERWPLPPGFGRDLHAPCLGYAHGAAGIADALADLADATGDDRWRSLARETLDPARPGERIGQHVLVLTETVSGPPQPPVWCKGAAGVAIPVGRLDGPDAATALLDDVAAARWSGPTRCHGLAGQIEVLLDAGRIDDARGLGELLAAYASPPSSGVRWLAPGLLEGNAGVASALARCVSPEVVPWATAAATRGARVGDVG